MIAESTAHDRGTPDVSGKPDARPRARGVVPSQRRAGSGTAPPGRRRPRRGHRARSGQAPTGPPDLAQTARDAVVRYLHDATAAAGAEPVVTAPPIAAADIAPKASAPSNPPTALEAPASLTPPALSITEFSAAPEAAAPEAAPKIAVGPNATGMTDT